MTTKLEKMYRELRDDYRESFTAAFEEKFGVAIESHFSIFSMELSSVRVDGVDFTPEQHMFLAAYCAGYQKAQNAILFRDNDDQNARYEREVAAERRAAGVTA